MQSFSEYLVEAKGKRLFIEGWHGTRKPFKPPFKETLQGSENDDGFSGKGFYFFGNEEDVKLYAFFSLISNFCL